MVEVQARETPASSSLAYTVAGPHPHARGRAGPIAPPCARPPTTPAAAASPPARAWAAAGPSGASGSGSYGAAPRQAGRLDPTSETSSSTAWSIISARRPSAGRCRWRAAPTAPSAFPGPRSPCGPCPARRPGAGSPGAAGRSPAPPDQPAACPRAHPVPPSAPRSRCLRHSEISEVYSPRGAAARPYRPCPAARTRSGSRPCSGPSNWGAAWPAREPQVRSLVHRISMRHHGGHAGRLLPRPLNSMIRRYHLPHQRLTQRARPRSARRAGRARVRARGGCGVAIARP
jgi:hypothetical protein